MKILYLSANPEFVKNPAEPDLLETAQEDYSEYTKLELWPELGEITSAFFEERMQGTVQLEVVPQASAADIVRYVEKFQPNIVHFSGHGEKQRLVVSDEEYFDGETKSAQWLKQTLHEKGVDVLLLNCCWSSTFVATLKDSVGFVIGAEKKLSSDLAQNFTKRFYHCIKDGLSVGAAFEEAKKVSEQYQGAPDSGELWDKPLQIKETTDEFTEAMRAHEVKLKEIQSSLKPDQEWDFIKVAIGFTVAVAAYAFLGGLLDKTWLGQFFSSYENWGEHKDWLTKEPIALLIIIAEKPLARILSFWWAKAAVESALKSVEFGLYTRDYSEKHNVEERIGRIVDWLAERKREAK